MRLHGRTRSGPPSRTDDWLMTYADMITLLFCVVLVFVSMAPAAKKISENPDVRAPAEQVALPPIAFGGAGPFRSLADADEPADDETEKAQASEAASHSVLASQPPKDKVGTLSPPAIRPIAERREAEGTANTHRLAMSVRVDASASKPGVLIDSAPGGERITTIEISSATLFESGSVTLRESGKKLLQSSVSDLESDRFKDYRITVEGHTDDAPIRTAQFDSNWELSTARAGAVVHFLCDQGVSARRLRAAGYADTSPVAPNRDTNGNAIPENQAKNRRVTIKLEKIEMAERVPLAGAYWAAGE